MYRESQGEHDEKLFRMLASREFVGYVSVASGAVMFVYGRAKPVTDGRMAIVLNHGETVFIMREMRDLIAAMQGIIHGLAVNDSEMVKMLPGWGEGGGSARQVYPPH